MDYPEGDRGGNEICVRVTQAGQPMDLHRFWDGVITSSQNLTRLRNEATALRNRQEFQRSQLTELGNTAFESWAKESFEIATKIAYRNGGRIGSLRVCEDHPNKPWNHRGCEAAGELCKNPRCDKDPDSIFLSVHCQVQPGRRQPPVRKTSLNA